MAPTQETASFDDIIQAGRQRKKAEHLAKEIFGRGKRTSSPLLGGRTKSGGAQSLASRITKPGQRASSSPITTRPKFQAAVNREADLIKTGRGPSQNPFIPERALNLKRNQNGNSILTKEFSIKGAAGPYVVVGSNFAPGTTSRDIQSSMEAIAGEMLSCAIITSYPTVIAEMVFQDKACAEMIVSTFNNQKADGRLLHVYLKNGPPTQLPEPEPAPALATVPVSTPQPVAATVEDQGSRELLSEKPSDYGSRSTNERRAEPEFQDGRYGFESKEDEMEVDVDDRRDQLPPQTSRRNDTRREHHDERFEERYGDGHRERYGYRQGYSRDTPRFNQRDYGGRDDRYRGGNRRPPEPTRLYSDQMYPRPRGGRYH